MWGRPFSVYVRTGIIWHNSIGDVWGARCLPYDYLELVRVPLESENGAGNYSQRSLSDDKLWIEDGAKTVLAQQFHEFGDTALFVSSKVVVDVPAEIIFPKIQSVFRAIADDVIKSIETEVAGFAELAP